MAVYRKDRVYKMIICYSDGSTYEVKEAMNIAVTKHRSGGYDIEYSYWYRKDVFKSFGFEYQDGIKIVKTNTHDVTKLIMVSREIGGVRETSIVEFGGKK